MGGKELLDALLVRGRLNDGREIPYAGGLVHGTYRGARTVSHGGADAGYRANFLRFPDERLSVAVLCNFPTADPGRRAQAVADVYLAARLADKEEPASVAVSAESLAAAAGIYRHPHSDAAIIVGLRDGALALDGGTGSELEPLSGTRFRIGGSTLVLDIDGARLLLPDTAGGYTRYEAAPAVDEKSLKLDDYVGVYASEELDTEYRVHLEAGALVMSHRKLEDRTLRPTYVDGFTAGPYDLTFARNATGDVTGFTLSSGRVRRVVFVRAP